MWYEITYPFPNFNGYTVEVWEWLSNFIPHFTGYVITYPYWDIQVKKGVPGNFHQLVTTPQMIHIFYYIYPHKYWVSLYVTWLHQPTPSTQSGPAIEEILAFLLISIHSRLYKAYKVVKPRPWVNNPLLHKFRFPLVLQYRKCWDSMGCETIPQNVMKYHMISSDIHQWWINEYFFQHKTISSAKGFNSTDYCIDRRRLKQYACDDEIDTINPSQWHLFHTNLH